MIEYSLLKWEVVICSLCCNLVVLLCSSCTVSALLLPPCSLICEVWKFRPAVLLRLCLSTLLYYSPVSSTKVPFVSSLATFADSQ
jgi:hypothetical protein